MSGVGGLTAEQFYEFRDQRTALVVPSRRYHNASVQITLALDATSFADQVAFLTAVNLTARWCRSITVSAPPVALDPRLAAAFGVPPMTVAESAITLAHAGDPFGRFTVQSAAESALHLAIGAGAPGDAYEILGRGWIATAGASVRDCRGDAENPLGAVLAACIGVAHIFRLAVGNPPLGAVRLSLWNLCGGQRGDDGPPVSEACLGRVLVIGCGAVGSAIVYLLPLVGVRGEFELVDRDCMEISNLSTGPIFFAERVGEEKAKLAAEYLKRSGLTAIAHPLWFDEAIATDHIFDERPDLVIPVANERDVRWQIQHQVPPLQIYGTTGSSWDAFLGRHIPLKEDCLACRFPRTKAEGEPPLACGSGNLPVIPELETPVTATLSFLPTASAVMAVAELLKTAAPGYPRNANFACLDFLGPLPDFVVVRHAPQRACVCGGQRPVWESLNGKTRFAPISM